MAAEEAVSSTLAPELVAQLADRPAGLGEAGARLWGDVAGTWILRGDERRVLMDACSEADLVDELEEERRRGPLTVKGSMGQPAPAPALTELRAHRSVLAALLRQLHLPDQDADDAPVSAQEKSRAARAAARARWDRRSG